MKSRSKALAVFLAALFFFVSLRSLFFVGQIGRLYELGQHVGHPGHLGRKCECPSCPSDGGEYLQILQSMGRPIPDVSERQFGGGGVADRKTSRRSPRGARRRDWSQYGQSAVVDSLLSGRRDGFYVEAGALDGRLHSNSLFFETERGWSGLLIEPSQLYYDNLLRRRRRRAWTLRACLSPGNFRASLSFDESAVPGLDRLAADGKARVSCFPLADVLDALNVTNVTLLSLDVEGAELAVLYAFPIKRFHVDVVLVEYLTAGDTPEKTQQKLAELIAYFRRLDGRYAIAGVTVSDVIAAEASLVDDAVTQENFRRSPEEWQRLARAKSAGPPPNGHGRRKKNGDDIRL